MVVVGSDVHKKTHTFVGVDEAGRELGHQTFPATTPGHQAAVCWARERFGTELRWAIEDCRHLSARLERDLLTAGQVTVRETGEDDGRAAPDRPHPRQVRSDRRGRGRQGCGA